MDALDECLDPGLQRRGRQTAGVLKIEYRAQFAARPVGGLDEVVRLCVRVRGADVRAGEVVRADLQARRLGAGSVRLVLVVDEAGVLGCLDVGELLARRPDLGPVDRALPVADVNALEPGARRLRRRRRRRGGGAPGPGTAMSPRRPRPAVERRGRGSSRRRVDRTTSSRTELPSQVNVDDQPSTIPAQTLVPSTGAFPCGSRPCWAYAQRHPSHFAYPGDRRIARSALAA